MWSASFTFPSVCFWGFGFSKMLQIPESREGSCWLPRMCAWELRFFHMFKKMSVTFEFNTVLSYYLSYNISIQMFTGLTFISLCLSTVCCSSCFFPLCCKLFRPFLLMYMSIPNTHAWIYYVLFSVFVTLIQSCYPHRTKKKKRSIPMLSDWCPINKYRTSEEIFLQWKESTRSFNLHPEASKYMNK